MNQIRLTEAQGDTVQQANNIFTTRQQLGKVKKTDHSEIRYLKGLVRELQKQLRVLRKELSYFKKRNHLFDDSQDEEIETDSEDTYPIFEPIQDNLKTCDMCGKGKLVEFEIIGKVFGTCNTCGERKKLKG